MHRFRVRLPLIACLLLVVAAPLFAGVKLPKPATYGLYLLGQRSGQAKAAFAETQFEGKPAIRMNLNSTMKVSALGEVEMLILMEQYLTPAGDPLFLRSEMSASGRKTVILARFFPNRVQCDIDASGQKSKKTVPIPKGIKLAADKDLDALSGKAPKIGEKETSYYFEPTSLSIQKIDSEVLRREKLTIGKRAYDTFVVKAVDGTTGESTEWVTADGDLIQSEAPLGIKMVREEPGDAVPAYAPPRDLLAAAAVRTQRPIEAPRTVRSLKVRITGIPERRLVISDARQRATASGSADHLTVVYDITAADLPEHGAQVVTGSLRTPYVADAPYLGITEPEIRNQAREIAGSETDRAVIARKIRDWVNHRIDHPGNAGLLRSAKEIMANRDGVCREYATLFAALARAAGIPTRLCGGVLYFHDGLYYHAWDECQLIDSPDGWFAFDATLPTDFVDATHIKFSQGDATDMFGAVRVVGLLKAEILAYR